MSSISIKMWININYASTIALVEKFSDHGECLSLGALQCFRHESSPNRDSMEQQLGCHILEVRMRRYTCITLESLTVIRVARVHNYVEITVYVIIF